MLTPSPSPSHDNPSPADLRARAAALAAQAAALQTQAATAEDERDRATVAAALAQVEAAQAAVDRQTAREAEAREQKRAADLARVQAEDADLCEAIRANGAEAMRLAGEFGDLETKARDLWSQILDLTRSIDHALDLRDQCAKRAADLGGACAPADLGALGRRGDKLIPVKWHAALAMKNASYDAVQSPVPILAEIGSRAVQMPLPPRSATAPTAPQG